MAMAAITSITSSNTSKLTDRKVAGFHRRYHGELCRVNLTESCFHSHRHILRSDFAERDFTSFKGRPKLLEDMPKGRGTQLPRHQDTEKGQGFTACQLAQKHNAELSNTVPL